MYDIGCGLYYLHQRSCVHGDLKSLNVLLTGDIRAKITDFGTTHLRSRSVKTNRQGINATGSLRWMAPELFDKRVINSKESDIYSAGIVFWEILTQKMPFEEAGVEEDQIKKFITDNEGEKIPDGMEQRYPKLCGLLQSCFKRNPKERPIISNVIQILDNAKGEFK